MAATLPQSRPTFLECNSTMIRRASRHLSLLYDREFTPVGLKTTQLVIIALIAGGAGNSIPELAEHLVMDRSTLGHNLRPLERAGLIERAPADGDRRRRVVRLTAAGAEKLAAAYKLWEVAQAKFHAEFGTDEAEQMRSMMLRVVGLTFESPADKA